MPSPLGGFPPTLNYTATTDHRTFARKCLVRDLEPAGTTILWPENKGPGKTVHAFTYDHLHLLHETSCNLLTHSFLRTLQCGKRSGLRAGANVVSTGGYVEVSPAYDEGIEDKQKYPAQL
jgi:hypothetical protein